LFVSRPLPQFLEEEKVDVALLGATFYSPDELPDRDVTKIPAPSGDRHHGAAWAPGEIRQAGILFIHLNHSNPALDPQGTARKAIEAKGFRVLRDGMEIGL